MLVHGHRLVRTQVLLENADPLVLKLQLRVLRIGDQWIGSLRISGPQRQKSTAQGQERFPMSTWHEKILDHEHA